jgi:LmbE family N-acetylglucosaminyl deacetylase
MKKPYRLLVVAHPDDETIFFSGVLQTKRDLPWHVICLTDGNADGRGVERHEELLAATKLLGARTVEQWTYRDLFEKRLPVDEIAARIRALPTPKEAYGHGPMGEYGHPHHQDASLALHRAFQDKVKIYSPAWNCPADFSVQLTPAQFRKKTHAFGEIYAKETARFVNVLPNMPVEGYRRFRLAEVEALAGYMRGERELKPSELKSTGWAAEMLPELREKLATRLF